MNPHRTQPPSLCQTALAALEADPLVLPGPVAEHLQVCQACSEARVLWLALEEVPPVAVPAGYFEGLGFRILRKLPPRRAPFSRRPVLWLAAAALLGAAGMGLTGFFMGKAVRAPLMEAAQPRDLPQHPDPQAETPFVDAEDSISQLSNLSPKEADETLRRLQNPPRLKAEPPAK